MTLDRLNHLSHAELCTATRSSRKLWLRLIVVLLLTVPACCSAYAQDEPSYAYKFSLPSRTTIERLVSLQTLPAREWQYHLGDIPHGERPEFDDGDWKAMAPETDTSRDAIWLRRWIEVPRTLNGYDLTGTHIWLTMDVAANELISEIVYFNGARVAMGTNLEDLLLFDDARPGQRVFVAVKLLATKNMKRYREAKLRIAFVADRPNPGDILKELMSAAVILPTITKDQAELAQQEKTLEAAAQTVDLPSLAAGDQKAFDTSLRAAQARLMALQPILRRYTAHLAGNAHIDAAWMWPWTETVDVVNRTFGTALQLMNEYPGYTFTQSAALYSEWMEQKYPEVFQGTEKRVKQGRWELVGGMWVEPDLNLPDGESQVRQLLVGKRYFQEKFGVDVRIGWNPDSFGFNWQLPQIYKKAGIDYFVTHKMHWNETNQLPLKLFWWQAPDGSRVLTYFPNGYGNHLEPERIADDLADAVQLNPGAMDMLHLYGIGDHGGGPTRDILDSGMHWMQPNMVVPELKFDTAGAFFDEMARRVDTEHAPVWNYKTLATGKTQLPQPPAEKISLPVWDDELYLEYHRGVYTTQAQHKANMRNSEEWMLNAEKYSSLAWLGGESYPERQLTEAWKKVLFNQFHDLAAGSGIAVIYKDAQHDYDEVHRISDAATQAALGQIDRHINTHASSGVPLVVWNPLGWARTDLVEATVQMPFGTKGSVSALDTDGATLPTQILSTDDTTHTYHLLIQAKNVPSLGYKVLRVVPETRPLGSDLRVSSTTLENDLLRVRVDPSTGCIVSLFDKRTNFESVAKGGCGNELEAFADKPAEYDAWNIDPGTLDHFTALTQADSVELVEKGPLRSIIRVTRHWSNSKFVQQIVFYAGMPRVDIVNDIDWHETHILLKAAFPLAAAGPMATYEIPYGSIERPTTRSNSIEAAKFEVPAIRWADLGDSSHGFSLINNSKYGYDAKDNVLRLTLLRSPTDPDPDADRGPQHFTYSLYPHAGTWREALTMRHGYDFNYLLSVFQVESHTGELPPSYSFLRIEPNNLVLTAMKRSEDGDDLILRFYETAGKWTTAQITLPAGATGAVRTNLMEKPEGDPLPVIGNRVALSVTPYSIDTIRISYKNRGLVFWHDQKSGETR
jgi:alpha-mannosidase